MKKMICLIMVAVFLLCIGMTAFVVEASSAKISTEMLEKLDTMQDDEIVKTWIELEEKPLFAEGELERMTEEQCGFSRAEIETLEQNSIYNETRGNLIVERRTARNLEVLKKLGLSESAVESQQYFWTDRAWTVSDGIPRIFNLNRSQIRYAAEVEEVKLIDIYKGQDIPEGYTEPPTEMPSDLKLLGDANGDSEISIDDVTYIQRFLAFFSDELFDPLTADVNSDGEPDIDDCTLIQMYLAFIDIDYPIDQLLT